MEFLRNCTRIIASLILLRIKLSTVAESFPNIGSFDEKGMGFKI